MATLLLPRVFINHMASGASVSAYADRGRARKLGKDTEVRTYGAGRRRAVTQAGRLNTVSVTLRNISELEAVSLELWIGQHVMYRDDRGRRFVCVYPALDYKEYVDNKTRYDVGLTLEELTWSEAAGV